MAYEEPSLKQTLHEILNGLQSERNLRETNEGLQRLRQSIPGVVESVGRGAIASVPGSVGDISQFSREYAPETMQSTFGRRIAPTTREILDYVPRITPTHEGATTLENVGSAIAPGVGGVAKDVALLTKGKPLGLMMIGPESKLWKPEMAFQAGKMEAKGKTPEEIHQTTGMVRGLDNQWRTEISDQFATLKGSGTYGETVMNRMSALEKDKTAEPVTLNDILYHPKLSEAYPDLMNTEVQFTKKGSKNKGELAHTNEGYIIRVNPDLPSDQATSTILHEVQHGIQGEEGWNRGANYQEILKKYDAQEKEIEERLKESNRALSKSVGTPDYEKLMAERDKIGKEYRDFVGEKGIGKYDKAYEEYAKHGGEAESRLTQLRAKLSDEERLKHFPYQFAPENHGLDINPDEAIITTHHPRSINIPSQSYDYRGSHTAPYKTEDGTTAPGHELDKIYPPDVYEPKGHIYYGSGDQMDKDTLNILRSAKGNPDHPITVYRAVPKEYAGEDIHPGDWVTPNLDYAEQHGQYFENGHQILEKTVPAKHIYTEGNSLHEFGYDPTD